MKNTILKLTKLTAPITILAFSLMLLNSNINAATKPIKLSIATSRWSPYVDDTLPGKGIATDVMVSVFKKAGYDVEISYEKWSRTLEGAQIGVYDAIATAWYTDQRAKIFAYTEAYMYNQLKFLVRSDSDMKFTNYYDLQDRSIGVVKDYAYGGEFMNARNFIRVQSIHVTQNINAVLRSKIDATIADERVLIFKVNNMLEASKKEFSILPKPVSIKGLHVAVSKMNPNHKKIVADFNKALASMKKDGSYNKILLKHESKELVW